MVPSVKHIERRGHMSVLGVRVAKYGQNRRFRLFHAPLAFLRPCLFLSLSEKSLFLRLSFLHPFLFTHHKNMIWLYFFFCKVRLIKTNHVLNIRKYYCFFNNHQKYFENAIKSIIKVIYRDMTKQEKKTTNLPQQIQRNQKKKVKQIMTN
jgi:hypothetical protein